MSGVLQYAADMKEIEVQLCDSPTCSRCALIWQLLALKEKQALLNK